MAERETQGKSQSINWVVVGFSIVGILSSLWFIFSAASNTYILSSDPYYDAHQCGAFTDPQGRLKFLIVGLLVGGAALYSIKITRDYWDITWYKKMIVFMSLVADVVLAMIVLMVWFFNMGCD